MSKHQKPTALTVRKAIVDDLPIIRSLDQASFPASDPAAESAAPGELEIGIEGGEILIAEMPQEPGKQPKIVGFLQYSTLRRGEKYFLAGLAVDQNHRRHGIGSHLTREFLRMVTDESPTPPLVTCTTNPRNIPAISTFLRNEFIVVRYIPEFFGEGKDRLYLEWGTGKSIPAGHSVLVPVENLTYLSSILDEVGYFVTDVVNMPHGAYFQVDELRESKEEELNSNETSVSSGFTGILLASTAFLLGLIVAAKTFPADVLLYLLSAFVFLTISLLAYANATGEIGRLHGIKFARFMVFGNIWSEFGGLYPLLHIVPLVVAIQFDNIALGLGACMIAVCGLTLYHGSGIALLGRYINNRVVGFVIFAYLSVSPAIGGLAFFLLGNAVAWSVANAVILLALALLCMFILKERTEKMEALQYRG